MMSLQEYESFLARLYTEYDFRKRFFDDPMVFLKESGIGQESFSKLMSLRREDVDFFAQGLLNKRWGVVKGLLPMVSQLLEGRAKELFLQYARNTPIRGMHHKHVNDAIAFSACLLKNKKLLSDFLLLKDLLSYEQLLMKSTIVQHKVLFCLMDYPVHLLDKNNLGRVQLKKRKTLIFLIRLHAGSRLRRMII